MSHKAVARDLPVWSRYLFNLLALTMVGFYCWTALLRPSSPQFHRGVYVLLTFLMIFIKYPMVSGKHSKLGTIVDGFLAILSGAAVSYWIFEYEALNLRAGAENETDFWVSVVGVGVSLEAARRMLGNSLLVISLAFLGFAYFGPHLPEFIQHGGFELKEIFTYIFTSTAGTFGIMANVLATYVILFIFFGAFLEKSGGSKFFIDLPLALVGHRAGGPGKVAVIASAIFGSISGSAIANTVSTGTFTIPLMKKSGFKPEVAGAIEPAASIGGMFLPPIMGAGGFIMAELTERPYSEIMAIAIGPALLYFLGVFGMIHFEAKRSGVTGLNREDTPQLREVLKTGSWFALPLLVIITVMVMDYSPGYAAVCGILTTVAVTWVVGENKMGPKAIAEAMILGAQQTLVIGATVGVIGVIVGVVELSGIGLQISDLIVSSAQSVSLDQWVPGFLSAWDTDINLATQKVVTLLLVALASLILGMGVPVTASYLIIAVLVVPAFGDLGISVMAAHMVVYWLSQDSNITPPVCVAAYAGAAIAKADPWRTGWIAFRYAKMLYIMPLMFVFVPAILLESSWDEIGISYLGAIGGTICFSAWIQGYLTRPVNGVWRWLLAISCICFFMPGIGSSVLGLAFLSVCIIRKGGSSGDDISLKMTAL